MTDLHLLFAGLGPLLWHWGIGIGLIIICLALEVFSSVIPIIGPLLAPFRKDLLWAAACVAIFLFAEGIGVHDEAARCNAKGQIVQSAVTRAVTAARSKPAHGVSDRWDRDQP